MGSHTVVLLSRNASFFKTIADWQLENVTLFVNDSPSEALAYMSDGDGDLLIFDTSGFGRTRHVIDKFLSLKGDADLVLIGEPALLTEFSGKKPQGAVRRIDPGTPIEELHSIVQRLLKLRNVRAQSGIVGRSRAVNQMLAMIAQTAPLDVNILIQGESGTGKELVAQAIHKHSSRATGPFLSLNCGALSEGVLESELFGHEKGAFTGAVSRHEGVFKRADKGTLFLDEVAELPLGMQTRFLRALETGEFTPVGGSASQRSNIRLVAATHRDLAVAVDEGIFRQDLFYRLRVVVITTPPLRERKEDIPALVQTFLKQENKSHGLKVRGVSSPAMSQFGKYDWPGNIRELRNMISSLVVIKQAGMIEADDLPEELQQESRRERSLYVPVPLKDKRSDEIGMEVLAAGLLELRHDVKDIKALLMRTSSYGSGLAIPVHEEFVDDAGMVYQEMQSGPNGDGDLRSAEKALIISALHSTGNNRRLAADKLGISERTLYRKIKSYGL